MMAVCFDCTRQKKVSEQYPRKIELILCEKCKAKLAIEERVGPKFAEKAEAEGSPAQVA